MRLRKMCGLAAALVVAGIGSAVSAAPLLPGTEIAAAPTVFDPAAGTLLATTTQPFTAFGFSGSVTQNVYQESMANNPLGGVTFTYELTNSTGSMHPLSRLTGAAYGLFALDATVFGAGQDPMTFSRSADGDVVGANFSLPDNQLDPGEISSLLVIRTDAPAWTDGWIGILNGGAAQVPGFAPIPEPAALSLLALAGLGLMRRRR